MGRRETILAAVDFGADTEKVLSYALWLSQALMDGNGDILMLNTMDYALTPPAYLLPYMEQEQETIGAELQKWADRLKACGSAAAGRIAVGRLIETFSKTIGELPVAALVIAHKSHMVRTSSSERLIKSLAVPMLVVRGQKADSALLGSVGVRNILCAVDFSDHSGKALEFARSLADKRSLTLKVTHILSSIKLNKSFDRLRNLSEEDREKYRKDAIREAEESICSTASICASSERIVRIGVPYKAINEIAAEQNADLIVIGAQGASSTKGVLLGSIAEALIKSSPCPVMLIR